VTESLAIKFAINRTQVCRQFIYFLSCLVVSVWHLVYRECSEIPSNKHGEIPSNKHALEKNH